MGFRSVFVSQATFTPEVSEEFGAKWGKHVYLSDNGGPVASRQEAKHFHWREMEEDLQAMAEWPDKGCRWDTALELLYFHECGGITKAIITKDSITYLEPDCWTEYKEVARPTHGYDCDRCMTMKNERSVGTGGVLVHEVVGGRAEHPSDVADRDRLSQVVRLLQSKGYCAEQNEADELPALRIFVKINGEPIMFISNRPWPAEMDADEISRFFENVAWAEIEWDCEQKLGPGTMTRLDNKRATWRTE